MATPPPLVTLPENISPKTPNLEKALKSNVPHGRHWGIRFGGLIALKYLIPLNWNILSENKEYKDLFYNILQECLKDPLDDVSGAAADLIQSLTVAIQINSKQIGKVNEIKNTVDRTPSTNFLGDKKGRRIYISIRVCIYIYIHL